MKYDEFLAAIRERGEYTDIAEAERVARVILSAFAARLNPDEVDDLAAQLPPEAAEMLSVQRFGVEEFLRRVAAGTGATERTAEWDAGAVLSTVADAVSGGELNDVLTQLPSGYAALFGRLGLAG
jgi:uncharacterized protein (DUF2267 family)